MWSKLYSIGSMNKIVKKKIAIIGSGGFAFCVREIIDSLCEYEVVGFIKKSGESNATFRDHDFNKIKSHGVNYLVNGIGNLSINNHLVIDLLDKYIKEGFEFPIIKHPSAVLSTGTLVGRGSIFMEHSVTKTHSTIGEFCVINSLAVVSHGCKIGNYSHLSLGSKIGGDSILGENVLLGINASVNQGVEVGSNTVVGSGSVIIKNLPPNKVAVGNPGRILREINGD